MPLNNPIQQLLSSTVRSSTNDSYLILLQHSMHQRHEMALETSQQAIYKRARVRTPAENAQRDYSGPVWFLYLARELQKAAKGLVFVQTTGSTDMDTALFNTGSSCDVTILNAASDPFGWDSEEEQESLNLEDLTRLADAIINQVEARKRPLVIESLTTIVMRHGLSRTLSFLRLLLNKCHTTVLVPILVETLTPTQHQAFEDLSQATFYLHGGDMTMIRQGVRERGNILRETIQFEIKTSETTGLLSVEIVTRERDGEDKILEEDVTESLPTAASTADSNTASVVGRSGKIKLEIENDDASPQKEESSKRPHIYVQDNDPEFDDMDEEDPDDDLDI